MNINSVHYCTAGPHGCSICHPCHPGCGCTSNNPNPDTSCRHCMHPAPFRCAINVVNGHHVDEICCFCGKRSCYTITYQNTSYTDMQQKHGPYIGNVEFNVNL